MIEQVFKYPGMLSLLSHALWLTDYACKGEVSIYSAGALTNIALAIRANSSFASTAKELVLMGGLVDMNLFRVCYIRSASINNNLTASECPKSELWNRLQFYCRS